jgi:hypothetical protein
MGDVVTIGDATLYCGDCLEILLPSLDAKRMRSSPTRPMASNLGNHDGAAESRKVLLTKQGGYLDTVERFL